MNLSFSVFLVFHEIADAVVISEKLHEEFDRLVRLLKTVFAEEIDDIGSDNGEIFHVLLGHDSPHR